jgi:hypothetical protein
MMLTGTNINASTNPARTPNPVSTIDGEAGKSTERPQ